MKIKEGYILDTIGEQKIAVSLDNAKDKFSGMIKLNEVAAFLWEQLSSDTDEETLVKALTQKYRVEEDTARKDVKKFVEKLDKNGILEK